MTGQAAVHGAINRRSGLRARLDRWRRRDGWLGLWPATAQEDRRGWLLRELLVVGLATLAALAAIGIAGSNRDEGMDLNAVSVLLLGIGVAALPFRHRYPIAALAVVFLTTLAYVTWYAQGPVWIPLVVTFGQIVLLSRRTVAVVTLLAGFVLFLWLGVIVGEEEAPRLSHVIGLGAWLAFLLSLTEVIRARSERAREAARSHAEALRRRATEERLRIARELHDVVAHNMSLISIQAGVALHLMDQRPEQARESLATIKQASKEALVELRSILGVLRQVDDDDDGDDGDGDGGDEADQADAIAGGGGADEGAGAPSAQEGPVVSGVDEMDRAAPRSPVPTLQRLGSLVRRASAAGIEVRVDSDADLDRLPRDVDLAAYRIIQESLTNVARHSDDKAAEVRLHVDHGVLVVEVLDEGRSVAGSAAARSGPARPASTRPGHVPSGPRGRSPTPTPSTAHIGSGSGIVGMRERAASVGGQLEAGPRPGRGFGVRARLPLGEEGDAVDPAAGGPVRRSRSRPTRSAARARRPESEESE